MPDNFNKTREIEQLRFWIHELTSFTPQQVDTIVETLKPEDVELPVL